MNFTIALLKGLKDNDIEMHSTHNEEKSAFTERFISTWLQYQKMCILIDQMV